MVSGVFISYRRTDSDHAAHRLYDRLRESLGADRVFMDVNTIDYGVDFIETIENAVSQCAILIAVIGRSWLDAKDAKGRRRLDSPDDFVRLEIATALKRNIRVIPFLLEGAAIPTAENLPENVKELTRRNVFRTNADSFATDVNRLIESVRSVVEASVRDSLNEEGSRRREEIRSRSETTPRSDTLAARALAELQKTLVKRQQKFLQKLGDKLLERTANPQLGDKIPVLKDLLPLGGKMREISLEELIEAAGRRFRAIIRGKKDIGLESQIDELVDSCQSVNRPLKKKQIALIRKAALAVVPDLISENVGDEVPESVEDVKRAEEIVLRKWAEFETELKGRLDLVAPEPD